MVKLKYVPSEENLADIFTKPMKKIAFKRLRDRLLKPTAAREEQK